MPDCSYCGESFDSEEEYVTHLEAVHEDELGPIDRRRINSASGGDGEGGVGSRTVLLGVLAVVPVAVLAYVLFFTGSAPGNSLPKPDTTPTGIGTVHEHGTINVTIDGRTFDFSRSKFQNPRQYRAFHFERGNGDVWHVHAQRVTLEYAMWTLGIGVTSDSVTYEGATYRNGSDATVIVEVNGEPVDPAEYILSGASAMNADEGDHIRVVVRTED